MQLTPERRKTMKGLFIGIPVLFGCIGLLAGLAAVGDGQSWIALLYGPLLAIGGAYALLGIVFGFAYLADWISK